MEAAYVVVPENMNRREGVVHDWLIDPAERTLEVYLRQGPRWEILAEHQGDAKVRAEPFETLELDLALLWGD